MPINNNIFSDVKLFVNNNKVACILTLGLAIVCFSLGKLAGRAIAWIREPYGTTKKTEVVGNKRLSNQSMPPSEIPISKISNHSTTLNQNLNPTYARPKLSPLPENKLNKPVRLHTPPDGIKYFASQATFYSYNAEGIRDYGWGCAWRAIQTCLSAYQIQVSFEDLFLHFGQSTVLQQLYKKKSPNEELPSNQLFAPHDLDSGWADPFIGEMVMTSYERPCSLETVNGIPSKCQSPKQVFHNKPSLDFKTFKERLELHFKQDNVIPIMIDDGTYTFNIIGMGSKEKNTILWIADPHIEEGVNDLQNEKTPNGLYTVTLDESGKITRDESKQLEISLNHEDQHQLTSMFSSSSYNGLKFDSKAWMVLFPSR